jgi:hypothetical protein
LSALENFGKEKGTSTLGKSDIDLIHRMAETLKGALNLEVNSKKRNPAHLQESEVENILLPDKDGYLRSVGQLCLNVSGHLEDFGDMFFLHSAFSEDLAVMFGVKTKGEHFEVELFLLIIIK